MARDKLITIRIEGDKRDAFNQLAKAQNTDTASLLYDFINQCLSGKIDISLVTGKKQWIDKIDNQLDTNRLDKLEATTQRIDRIDIAIQRLDNRIDGIETITQRLAKRLDDWIEAFSDRLSDCDRELSEKITSLEHRLNALSIQLDSQQDSQQLDRIDTDSQKDSQQENPDIEPVATVETVYTVEAALEKVESDSSIEPDKGAIGPVPDDSDPIESVKGEGMNAKDAAKYLETKKVTVSYDSLHRWIGQEKIPDTSPQGRGARKHLILRGKLYYPIN
jgi:hypothetical protein